LQHPGRVLHRTGTFAQVCTQCKTVQIPPLLARAGLDCSSTSSTTR
jgi:hypothetical protein